MNRLKEMREDKDLLQREIAEQLGITQRNYSYLETGQTLLTEDILEKLADFYQTSTDYILYRTDERKPYSKSIVNYHALKVRGFLLGAESTFSE